MIWLRYGACVLLFLSLFFLPEPNEDYLFLQTIHQMAEECFEELPEAPTAIHLEELIVI